MARPKGSKNKKSILTVADVEAQATAKLIEKQTLEEDMQGILNALDEQKKLLKSKKKELRGIDKALASLEEKKAEAEAREAAIKKKQEIEQAIEAVISSGHSADEILTALDVLNQ